MPEKTIVDASVPNAGRIYDYLLGGHCLLYTSPSPRD